MSLVCYERESYYSPLHRSEIRSKQNFQWMRLITLLNEYQFPSFKYAVTLTIPVFMTINFWLTKCLCIKELVTWIFVNVFSMRQFFPLNDIALIAVTVVSYDICLHSPTILRFLIFRVKSCACFFLQSYYLIIPWHDTTTQI